MPKTFKGQRLSLGLTQQELADKCTEEGAEVSDVTLSAIERGLWSPRPGLRRVVCDLLDLPITFDFRQAANDDERAAS